MLHRLLRRRRADEVEKVRADSSIVSMSSILGVDCPRSRGREVDVLSLSGVAYASRIPGNASTQAASFAGRIGRASPARLSSRHRSR